MFKLNGLHRLDLDVIEAGGYNVQCFHFRILVKKVLKNWFTPEEPAAAPAPAVAAKIELCGFKRMSKDDRSALEKAGCVKLTRNPYGDDATCDADDNVTIAADFAEGDSVIGYGSTISAAIYDIVWRLI